MMPIGRARGELDSALSADVRLRLLSALSPVGSDRGGTCPMTRRLNHSNQLTAHAAVARVGSNASDDQRHGTCGLVVDGAGATRRARVARLPAFDKREGSAARLPHSLPMDVHALLR
jgi:hypothetical protein